MTVEEQTENRQKWVTALRSGKYEQVEGMLHSKNGFCCLGVACDISGLGEWETNSAPNEDGNSFVYYTYLGENDILPNELVEWLGLTHNMGTLNQNKNSDLTHANDRSMSFEEIAILIESDVLNVE